jgi:peptidoglycan-associated lipoprotein
MEKNMKRAYLLISLALLLAGCQNDPEVSDTAAPVSDLKGAQTGTQTTIDSTRMSGDPLTDPKHPLYKGLQARSIYFDYDSDAIKSEYVAVVEAHARFLRDNPSRKVLVQGNADERGSREYNLALGQRRADAIKSRMTLLGAKTTQVESVSLGEEKPKCSDATEDCFAQNRRGDLVY